MKLRKYARQNGRMTQYQLMQGVITMSMIARIDFPRNELACALRGMRIEVRKEALRHGIRRVR